MNFKSKWTDEMVATLRVLWTEGYSGSEIASEMKVSRAAVNNKIDRLGLPTRRGAARYSHRREVEAPLPPTKVLVPWHMDDVGCRARIVGCIEGAACNALSQ